MKIRELKEYRKKPLAEIEKTINEQKTKLASLSFDLFQGKVKNVKEIRALKKNIAQLFTIRTELEKISINH